MSVGLYAIIGLLGNINKKYDILYLATYERTNAMKEPSCVKPYTAFITDVFNCISQYFFDSRNPLIAFAERDKTIYTGSQDCAVLRNTDALLFYSVFCDNNDLFSIDIDERLLKKSSIYPDELKIMHSCYPKNIRRWLNGTISRKKICRIDFCILVWCHACGWNNFSNENILLQCQNDLANICTKYSDSAAPLSFSIKSLWEASSWAYDHSF